jgi:hypothetical protein
MELLQKKEVGLHKEKKVPLEIIKPFTSFVSGDKDFFFKYIYILPVFGSVWVRACACLDRLVIRIILSIIYTKMGCLVLYFTKIY